VSTLVVVAGLVCGGMTIYLGAMAALIRRRTKCPACDHPTLRMWSIKPRTASGSAPRSDESDLAHRSAVWPTSGAPGVDHRFYKCDACNAEFGREGKGPLVPKATWDSGGRGDIPRATVVTTSPKDRA